MDCPLSLVVAPAGSGKTVLLSQWAHARPDVAVAWFDITAADAPAASFARRLVEQIAAVAPDFQPPAAAAKLADQRLGEPFLESLAAGMAGAGTIVLVFDDLDRLPGGALLTDLWRLVDLLPPNAHAIFASRVDLKLGWSRHRLQHGLVEIRQRELAFDRETTAQVLAAITGRPVDDDLAAAVTARTEGWAAGVQLTALRLRSVDDPGELVAAITDSDRLIVDYLSEEVLDAMDPGRREALMVLAVLDEVSAGLITAVAHTPGAEFLARLERDSLFLVPVTGRAGWFRLHRLFRNLLLYRLRASDDHAEARILEAAADWHLEEGDLDAAVECLQRAHKWERVMDAMLSTGREVYEEMRTTTVAHWLSLVPPEVLATRPDAELLMAIAQGMGGNAARSADAFEKVLSHADLCDGHRQVALAYAAAGVQFEPRPEVFLEASRQALAALEQHPDAVLPDLMGLTSRAMLLLISRLSLGRALLMLGQLDEAHDALVDAHDAGSLSYPPYRVQALGSLALVEALTGRLGAASDHADEALEAAQEVGLLSHPAPADAYLARAVMAIQRGDPEAGAIALTEGRIRAASNHRTQLLWFAHLAAQLIEPGDAAPAAGPTGPPPPFVRQALTALVLRRSRLRGTPSAPPRPASSWSPLAFEEIASLLASRDLVAAQGRLAHFGARGRARSPLTTVEFALLAGWESSLEGHRVQSQEHVAAALAVAEPEGLVHPFVRVGPHVLDLLDRVPGRRSEFVRRVEDRLRADTSPRTASPFDDLTPRERELFAYLPSRLTIPDIAARCFVSTNTVKTHLGHIYGKLGVRGRDEAIERAVEAGLIDPRDFSRIS
ncbi:LuxR C-terminal-related transcriptional regulator [Microbacterium sp. W1N]|uniref:LuxR C-terminal-related transcriptional regulator n=1 Tax=Microbacterium festucae TaxID=2977531 RepID=UPI0021BE91F6|nr:LuxR C-terminal-related transcriptional regulator [Microbacterium festucae]MCT9821082.1 LuxR C-terminal-related transcriptional regulator [Microbacterium festucae]